ncbi:tyrosine-type recombinase/integrase [Metasolibacillus meyeri]|uniref:tyrosine-type recombinase/integrase n=1 Tax=Metasolibacillus meyeri TaxID=1071052 RepID=UPI00187D14ED|nr:tyrosine-type recombinase/integrase [Metasolibacillus meyeri]
MQQSILLDKAIQQYLQHLSFRKYSEQTIRGYDIDLRQLNHFLTHLVNAPIFIDEVTAEHLESFQQYLISQQLSPASINRKTHSSKSLFKWALAKKMIAANCALEIIPLKLPHNERHFLTKAMLQQFLQHVHHPTIQIIAQFIANTGLRITECTQLLLTDINWDLHTVNVVHGKGGKSRTVPLNASIYNLLHHYIAEIRPKNCTSLYLFALPKTGSISAQYVNSIFKNASTEMKHPKPITCHILRHTFASNLVKNNVHIAVIQRLLGHANVRTTSVYMHTDFKELQQAVNSLNCLGGAFR